MKISSILRRFGAYCIDHIVLLIIALIISFLSTKLFGQTSGALMGFIETFLNKIFSQELSHLFNPNHMHISMLICFLAYFIYFKPF